MLSKICKILLIIFLPIYLLLTSVEFASYNVNFYMKNFKENNISENTGLKEKELKYISNEIIKYIDGSRDNFDIVNSDGESYFNEREITHMEDVLVLFNKGRVLKQISLIIVILTIIYLFIKERESIPKTLIRMFIAWFIVFLVIVALSLLNFNKLFEVFHKILFTNDLWLLDPREDFLINLLTEDFFFELFLKIMVVFLVKMIILALIGVVFNRRNKYEKSSSYNGRT